ncbi:MAG: hypothetical protein F4Y61_05590 [Rhodothermaceae bacterium]|nr:hypothetical protein [Rhodothermaceae bacterium]
MALASEHQVAGADYYAEVFAVFAHAVGAAASGDAAHAAAHYREAVWHAVAAANATSAAEARAAYPLPEGNRQRPRLLWAAGSRSALIEGLAR